jgi:hypothetical protein
MNYFQVGIDGIGGRAQSSKLPAAVEFAALQPCRPHCSPTFASLARQAKPRWALVAHLGQPCRFKFACCCCWNIIPSCRVWCFCLSLRPIAEKGNRAWDNATATTRSPPLPTHRGSTSTTTTTRCRPQPTTATASQVSTPLALSWTGCLSAPNPSSKQLRSNRPSKSPTLTIFGDN